MGFASAHACQRRMCMLFVECLPAHQVPVCLPAVWLLLRWQAEFGRLDVLVNNAGYTWDGVIHKMGDKQWQVRLVAPAEARHRACWCM